MTFDDILEMDPRDVVDKLRRFDLLQAELDARDECIAMHNELINRLHRDLHESANLVGDIHKAGKLSAELRQRAADHVVKHGHPQDVPEYHEPQE